MHRWIAEARLYVPEENAKYNGPVIVVIDAFFKRPMSHLKRNQRVKQNAPTTHTQKPDGDNIAKFVCDCLSKVAYQDDKQVVDLRVRKYWTNNNSCVKVTLRYVK